MGETQIQRNGYGTGALFGDPTAFAGALAHDDSDPSMITLLPVRVLRD